MDKPLTVAQGKSSLQHSTHSLLLSVIVLMAIDSQGLVSAQATTDPALSLPEECKSPQHCAIFPHTIIRLARICKPAFRSSKVALKRRTAAVEYISFIYVDRHRYILYIELPLYKYIYIGSLPHYPWELKKPITTVHTAEYPPTL